MDLVKKLLYHLHNKRGQGMIEYLFVILLIALVVISSLTPVSSILVAKFEEFTAVISGSN